MRRRANALRGAVLPHGPVDLIRQLALFAAAYLGYELVRAVVATTGQRPFTDAARIISLERRLGVFVEPQIERWVGTHAHPLLVASDWIYLNAHIVVSVVALVYIYVRRNDSFYFVRNMFVLSMALALVGYALFPTAPPRLMPQYGFTDAIESFAGPAVNHSQLLNEYAAVPSMHVCWALMTGGAMAALTKRRLVRALWLAYPLLIAFVVIVTANHYFTDVVLGAVTAGVSALLARQLLARARPDAWAFSGAAAESGGAAA
jgi:membrane-associated phospholipid phosphatase